jgi:transcriptional regulator with XRE-family HTH domain
LLAGPTIRRRRLGADLRRLREERSLRLEDVAAHLGVAASTLSRIETGKAPTRTSYLALMLDLYGVEDPRQRKLLTDLAREGQRKGWWADSEDLLAAGAGNYLGLEAEACVLRSFALQVVPGLLQTEQYATAVCRASRPDLGPEQIRRLVAVRMRRQELLRGTARHRLHLVIDESALLRSFGSAGVMSGQLKHLLALTRQAQVSVQVLTLAKARTVLTEPFTMLSFADESDADVACATTIRGQLVFEQRPAEVGVLRATFEALTRAAMSADESRQLISGLAGENLAAGQPPRPA